MEPGTPAREEGHVGDDNDTMEGVKVVSGGM